MSEVPQNILGYGDGQYLPNPAYYGFEWPDIQAALERGQKLYRHSVKLSSEQQRLTEEKHSLHNDLVHAQAGVALAAVGMADKKIGNAGTRVDVPKATKRIREIEKRLEELVSEQMGVRQAIERHKADVMREFELARASGIKADEIREANSKERAEVAELEARVQAIRLRISNREQLGRMLGMHQGEFLA